MKRNRNSHLLITAGLAVITGAAMADESAETKIERAMSAAPPSVSAEATILDNDGTVLRPGSNGWTCLPNTMPGDKSPLCNDALWMKMMQALGNQEPFEADGIGISYMLQGDIGAGVSNSNPFHHDHANAEDYTEMGPHMMIIVPKELLEGVNRDPSTGGPFVMWGDTPYAHIMVPVATKVEYAQPD
jgi:hypothetical protein